ncbi:trans-sulfuration enzyme family protein [Sporomusa acidovorans]|uniref:Cystathionine gamma-lyase n=1 Tax=Sporomusa acidovorans (strain ATCC 49682 / DSM 3132 / Mol) TaxID=1123286 RepID=A0ABZ3IYP1_SPOA4|nr:PLP-dependent aspartate aminotransferase family protein [Sporomusa acidovorans]OZC17276.1 cystathionine gamma-lyase [Sporomusa acidovorans DSM 3132]SDF16353.1 cysteine synthase /cystathionine gamma-synthase [Sporomusa acidovorans]
MKISTKIVRAGLVTDKSTGAISTPIYQTATFRHPELGRSTGYDYSRSQNPTRKAVEETLAALEEGQAGFAFASGMAAITAVLMLYRPGDHLIITEDCYGGTYRVLDKLFTQFGLSATFVDTSDTQQVRQALQPATKAIILETPTNPLMKIADIKAITAIAREAGAQPIHVIVDNTFLSPYLQRPLTLGADIVIHSGSKYLSGHNDVVCGLVVAGDPLLCEKIGFIQNATGSILGPQDCWLLLRGIKTLAIRLRQHEKNAQAVAEWLTQHPSVTKVYYPGLKDHPGKAIQDAQATGYGGMLSFVVDHPRLPAQVLRKVKVLQFAESLGGVESLITFPAIQTHADIPVTIRERLGISDCLLRLSVGIEDVEDIIADLAQALEQ